MAGTRTASQWAGRRRVAGEADHVECSTADNGDLPLVIRPRTATDLVRWCHDHTERLDTWLRQHGAVLFRGFGADQGTLSALSSVLGKNAADGERSTPRTALGEGVYTSTEHPADQTIALHNESSYRRHPPARLLFCAVRPAEEGGATPLADCRAVLRRLSRELVAEFADRGVRYVRTYNPGLGLSWPEAFATTDATVVEDYCAAEGIVAEWLPDGRLRTRQDRPAIVQHPVTGDPVWFNHAAFFHDSSLPDAVREALHSEYSGDELPTSTWFGDGGEIPISSIEDIRAAYQAETVATPWERGDLLVVDNVLVAHGREPYRGSRRVLVSMITGDVHVPASPADGA